MIHLYPFVPRGRHGGTIRLCSALAGSSRVAPTELYYFDPSSAGWLKPRAGAELDHLLNAPPGEPLNATPGIKRRLFPSTLWESGRRARGALESLLARPGWLNGARMVLHTSYLAPAAARFRARGAPTLVDVYDLVWRAHANDAADGPAAMRPARRAYAASVRPRELRGLRRADRLVVAGHADLGALGNEVRSAAWIPTSSRIDAASVAPRRASGLKTLRVGFLGHFAHEPTRISAEALLASPLAAADDVQLVIAGGGSRSAIGHRGGAEILGEVSRSEDFYSCIDVVVAPVLGSSGIKTKLAEAVLAGRPAVTTPRGAEGFSPELRRHLLVRPLSEIRADQIREYATAWDADVATADFERISGWDTAITAYARAVEAL